MLITSSYLLYFQSAVYVVVLLTVQQRKIVEQRYPPFVLVVPLVVD